MTSTLLRPSIGAIVLAAALVAGCGGGDDGPPARGSLASSQSVALATAASIDASTSASGIQGLTGAAKCDVDVRYVVYNTRDPHDAAVRASAAIMLPRGTGAACTGPRPVVLYAHGTTTAKSKNMARVADTNPDPAVDNSDSEAQLVMAMFAAQGFIVVAPNYLGYDVSSLPYHPYLNAEAQAIDVIDGLRAAKSYIRLAGSAEASDKLFITGYSQGGHVAMATHKILERDYAREFTVTASGPMSGPYNLVGFADVITGPGPINAGATIFTPMLLTSYQKSYGNVYGKPSDVYQAPFDATAESLFPTDTPVATLIAQGKLPNDPTFTKLFGTGGLLTDAFRAGYTSSAYRADLQKNTLLGWSPQHPMVLCGGQGDPTVFYAVNTTVAAADFASRGIGVTAWDLENRASLPADATGDAIYDGFQAQKAAAGANAQAWYHGTLVPPFCETLVRGFFEQVLAGT